MALYVVATPIGNLKDITERAKEVLKSASVIICEQIEVSLKLINHIGARPERIIPINKVSDEVLEDLRNKDGAIIVSAGTPGISDPGSKVIKACFENGIKVVPIPGPSAFVAALSVCGFDTSRFVFLGFIPKKGRKNFLKKLKEGLEHLPFSPLLVFYESPHRIIPTLEDVMEIFGQNYQVFLAREMTKVFEEFIRGRISDVIQELYSRIKHSKVIKGEITFILSD